MQPNFIMLKSSLTLPISSKLRDLLKTSVMIVQYNRLFQVLKSFQTFWCVRICTFIFKTFFLAYCYIIIRLQNHQNLLFGLILCEQYVAKCYGCSKMTQFLQLCSSNASFCICSSCLLGQSTKHFPEKLWLANAVE